MTADFACIRDKIERAFRNRERLHLDVEQVQTLVRSPLFQMLAELAAKEFAVTWQEELDQTVQKAMPTEPNSDHFGSTGGPTEKVGSSAGMTMAGASDLLESAARRRALSIVTKMGARRRKP